MYMGEYQRLYRIIPKTIYSILNQKKLNLHGGGLSKRNFIHIDDVSIATLKIMTLGKNGEAYHGFRRYNGFHKKCGEKNM